MWPCDGVVHIYNNNTGHVEIRDVVSFIKSYVSYRVYGMRGYTDDTVEALHACGL